MQAVVCHEVQRPIWKRNSEPANRWKLVESLTSTFDSKVADSAQRVFGLEVNQLPLVKKTYSLSNPGKFGLEYAYLIALRTRCHLLVIGYEDGALTSSKIQNLRRPGSQRDNQIFSSLSLAPATSHVVYSTTVSNGTLETMAPGDSFDGWLHLNLKHSADIASEYIRQVALWVAIERSLLTWAVSKLVSRSKIHIPLTFRYWHISRMLGKTIAHPPVDKTEFSHGIQELRDSLNLDRLRQELHSRANSAIERFASGGTFAAAVIAAIAFSADLIWG